MKTIAENGIMRLLLVVFAVISLMACQREYMFYDQNLQDGIYMKDLGMKEVSLKDTITCSFNKVDLDSTNWSLPIYVLGMPRDQDRVFTVTKVDSVTTARQGIHYNIGSLVVKAGQVKGEIPFTFYRNRDPELQNRSVSLLVQLVEDEQFRPVMGSSQYIVLADWPEPQPKWWPTKLFGPYSPIVMTIFFQSYWKMEEIATYQYDKMVKDCGRDMEKAYWTTTPFGTRTNIPQNVVKKYIVPPMREYFAEHPTEGVNIPEPVIQ